MTVKVALTHRISGSIRTILFSMTNREIFENEPLKEIQLLHISEAMKDNDITQLDAGYKWL